MFAGERGDEGGSVEEGDVGRVTVVKLLAVEQGTAPAVKVDRPVVGVRHPAPNENGPSRFTTRHPDDLLAELVGKEPYHSPPGTRRAQECKGAAAWLESPGPVRATR